MTHVEAYTIHTAASGRHWIAWLTRDDSAKPDRGVLLVAASRDDAETRARDWIAQLSAAAALDPPQ